MKTTNEKPSLFGASKPAFAAATTAFKSTTSAFKKAKDDVDEDDDEADVRDECDATLAILTGESLTGLSARDAAENARMDGELDTEYWCALVFRDRAAKNHFLAAVGQGDGGGKYIDGHEVAKAMGIVDMPAPLPLQKLPKVSPRWLKHT